MTDVFLMQVGDIFPVFRSVVLAVPKIDITFRQEVLRGIRVFKGTWLSPTQGDGPNEGILLFVVHKVPICLRLQGLLTTLGAEAFYFYEGFKDTNGKAKANYDKGLADAVSVTAEEAGNENEEKVSVSGRL